MGDFDGRRVAVGAGVESTPGTAVAPSHWIQHEEISFRQRAEKVMNESVMGNPVSNNAVDVVRKFAEGSISGKVMDRSFGLLLYAALGSLSTGANADGSGNVYDHTFSLASDNQGKSLTLAVDDPNKDLRYALAMLRSLNIQVDVGEYVRYTADFVSKPGATASNTAAYVAENEFKAKHAAVKLAANVAGLSGASALPLTSFNLSIEKTVEPEYVFGSVEPSAIYQHNFVISGEFNLRYTDQTHFDSFFDNDYQALSLDVTNSDVTIGTGENPGMVFTLPRVAFENWEDDASRDDMVRQTIQFQGLFSIADSYALQAVLTNLVSSY